MAQDTSRFWAKVQVGGPDECWPWAGALTGRPGAKYGCILWAGRVAKAHRVAWTLAHGPIPDGLMVLHSCDNPPCVNPAHLFLGTNADNMADMAAKGRAKTPRGDANGAHTHPERRPRGNTHGMAKLTDDQVEAIRAQWDAGDGVSWSQSAREYGVWPSTIQRVVLRQRRIV